MLCRRCCIWILIQIKIITIAAQSNSHSNYWLKFFRNPSEPAIAHVQHCGSWCIAYYTHFVVIFNHQFKESLYCVSVFLMEILFIVCFSLCWSNDDDDVVVVALNNERAQNREKNWKIETTTSASTDVAIFFWWCFFLFCFSLLSFDRVQLQTQSTNSRT